MKGDIVEKLIYLQETVVVNKLYWVHMLYFMK